MGWTNFHLNEPVKEWFKHDWNEKMVVLDVAIVKRSTLYGAIKNTVTNEVFCAVFLLRWSRSYYNFSYKDMTEFAGPCETECPERIMKLLTPLNDTNDPNGYAREWRTKVEKFWDIKRKINTGKFLIKTELPVIFTSGVHFSYFKVEGKHYLAGELQANGIFASFMRVRMNLRNYDYDLIPITI